jgi:hypothetical protein
LTEIVGDTRSVPRDLPSGTVTFLFTDIEGSTRLLRQLGPDVYAEALTEHRRVLRDAFAGSGISDVTDSRISTLQPACSSSASPTSRLYERRVLLTSLLRRRTSSGASASSSRRLRSGLTATRAS